jgi:hypothetical protein
MFSAGAFFAPAKYLPATIYVLEAVDPAHSGTVRKTPGWPRSWASFSLL